MDADLSKRGMLVWGRSQRAALDGDVDTAADLLDHAGRMLADAGDWLDAARVYLDLALVSVETVDPLRQRRALVRAMEMLGRDGSVKGQKALTLLTSASEQEPPAMSMVGLVRAKLLALDAVLAVA